MLLPLTRSARSARLAIAVCAAVLCPPPVVGAQPLVAATASSAEIDWAKAPEVTVELGDHHYSPSDLRFELGKPVILRLKNVGGTSHDMNGGSFFKAIALKMAKTRSGHVVTSEVHSIYVRPKQEMELWFVPTRAGDFSFFCSIPGHQEAGMEGVVAVR